MEELIVSSPKYEKNTCELFSSFLPKSTNRWLLAPVYVLCHHVQDSGDQREINAKKYNFHKMEKKQEINKRLDILVLSPE